VNLEEAYGARLDFLRDEDGDGFADALGRGRVDR
jgi:hypothetical protein